MLLKTIFIGALTIVATHGLDPPKITHFEWGKIEVLHNGKDARFKDAILTPTYSKEWNWKLDGAHHKPGITIAAIEQNKLFENADNIRYCKQKQKQKIICKMQKTKTRFRIFGYWNPIKQSQNTTNWLKMVKSGRFISFNMLSQ